MNIFVSISSFAKFDYTPRELLYHAGLKVKLNPYGRKMTEIELLNLATEASGLIAGTETLDSKTLDQLPHLKVISRCGAGMDNVDVKKAKRLGIKVYNTPDIPTLAVAELTIGLILALLRKISLMDREMHNGLWKKRMGNLLAGKQVGIIGLGRIGRKVAEVLKAMGAEVFYTDPKVTEKEAGITPRVELKELLGKSDIISLHLTHSNKNNKLLGQKQISIIKQGAFLINCSRGGTVDEKVLYLALKKGKIAGAAIDVFDKEPYKGPLKKLDNVILTPHIGSYAIEARVKMEIQAVKNLIKGLKHPTD